MLRKMIAFHRDEENHWVAELECGHTQHVRHDPPWQNRTWVVSEKGRQEKMGSELFCKKCLDSGSHGMSGCKKNGGRSGEDNGY